MLVSGFKVRVWVRIGRGGGGIRNKMLLLVIRVWGVGFKDWLQGYLAHKKSQPPPRTDVGS